MAKADTLVEIDGMKFRIPRFGVMQSLKLKAELIKVFGTTITKLVDNGKGGVNLDIEVEDINLTEVVSELSDKITPDKLESMFYKILEYTVWENPNGRVNLGTPSGFETTFVDAGGLTPYKVVFEVLKAEYASFFGGKLDGVNTGARVLNTIPET